MIHPRLSVNPSSFPAEMPLAEILATVARLGFSSVDAPRVRLVPLGWDSGLDLLEASGLAVTTFIHRTMFLLDRPETWERGQAMIRETIDGATRFGAPVYGTTGPGPAVGLTWEESAQRFEAAVSPCVAYARERGVRLMIETTQPLFADVHFLHTLRDTVDVCEAAGLDLCLDVHGTWNERGLRQTIARAGPRLGLVQLSDYRPGMRSLDRGVCGAGVMPLERIIAWVLETGYDGRFDLELWGDSGMPDEEALLRSAEHVGAIIDRLGA
ncbi:MAG: sugar phosphate isomerase/epimerase [Actinobacteria bacterium]|nr:sugar phosphate isomerase/epimerase [Actinomycetota bacterium]